MALPKRQLTLKTNAPNIAQVRQWTAEQVADWMKTVNDGLFANYCENVLLLKINGSDLMNLTANDMTEKLGITIPNHITTLQAKIERLKKKTKRRTRGGNRSPIAQTESVELDDIPDTNHKNGHQSYSLNDTNNGSNKPSNHTKHFKKAQSMVVGSSTNHKLFSMMDNSDLYDKKNNDYGQSQIKNFQIQRAQTVALKTNNDDQKHQYKHKNSNTQQLKRQLTEQNVDKKNKYLYKDLGKKLWPNETSNIVKEGWTKKRGVRRSGFKKRWTILRENGHLYYFEKRPTKNDLPQGMLDLANVLKIEYVADDEPNTFNCKTKERDWIFTAMSGGELVGWMSSLNKILEKINN